MFEVHFGFMCLHVCMWMIFRVACVFLPLSRWLSICSRMETKLMNSGDESSIVSKQEWSSRVFTENLNTNKKRFDQLLDALMWAINADFLHWHQSISLSDPRMNYVTIRLSGMLILLHTYTCLGLLIRIRTNKQRRRIFSFLSSIKLPEK